MDQLGDIWTSIAVAIAAVSTLIARYKKTNVNDPWYQRIATTFDITQIFDSTRRLDD